MPNPGVPAVAGRLIDVLIRDNSSGAVPTAPHSLRNLKDSIRGVPFELLTKGMSGVLDASSLLDAVRSLLKVPGLDLSNIGQFQSILSKLASGQAQAADVMNAMGSGGALGASLLGFGGALEQVTQAAKGQTSGGTA